MKLYFNIFILLCCTTTVLKAQLKATATGIFEVSCSNSKSGKIEINVTGAAAPVTFLWQDNNTDANRENLSAGIYTVTISDAINQKLIGSYEIKSPTPMVFNAGFHWNCAIWGPPVDEDYLSTDEGALRNATYPINITEYDKKAGTIYQGPYTVFDSLFSIDFNKQKYCKIVDSRQCTLVYDPILPKWDVSNFTVDVTPKFPEFNNYLNVGEEIKLYGSFSIPKDSVKNIEWGIFENRKLVVTFLESCKFCNEIQYKFKDSIQISYNVIDIHGCSRAFFINFFPIIPPPITINSNTFLPTVFSPNDDGINDQLTINSADGIEKVRWMRVFDIWGNLVFEQKDFPPSDNHYGWDGTYKGIAANMGIYTCTYRVLLKDGSEKTFNNSVSLMR